MMQPLIGDRMKPRPHLPALALAAAAIALLPGCAQIAVTAGTAVASAATEERGVAGVASDTAIRAEINALWFDHDLDMFVSVQLEVVEGRVLLAGHVQKPEHRVDAVRLAWRAEGVGEVINEIRVAGSRGIGGYSRDTWIAARLRARILLDKQIASINYSIDCVAGTVYLMGIAQDRAELVRVDAHAREIPYVKRVISHVVLKDDRRRRRG